MSDTHKTAVAVIERKDIATTRTMHPVVAAALQNGHDPSMLRELLTLQREYEAGEAKKAFTRALVDLKRDLPAVIAKDKEVDFTSAKGRTNYRHASLAGIMDAVQPALTRHGFSLGWEPSNDGQTVTVVCRLTHGEGHTETAKLTATPDQSGNKNSVQGIASTITYLQRYSALSILGIATADMDDGEARAAAGGDDSVDSNRNLAVLGRLQTKYHRTAAEAEAYVGKPVSQWTAADVERLKAWAKAPPAGKDESTGVVHPETWDAESAVEAAGGV